MVIIRPNIHNQEKEMYAKQNCGSTDIRNTGCYGVAVDIGTTTISLSLFSLGDKKHIKNITETNAQTRYGTDVMMRIMHANTGRTAMLHGLVIRQIEYMLECVSKDICRPDNIKEMTVTGNTTMCHLFLNKDLSGMAGAPFTPAYEGSVTTLGESTGLNKYPLLNIYVLPSATAHVGADAVSMLCAKELYAPDKIQLAIDIGTNAEILLNNRGEIYACSAAAGSAFEGKGTKCGMRAVNGAVNGIKIVKTTGNILLDVINTDTAQDVTPSGICGSGLVDAVAELLKVGVLRDDGYLMECDEALNSGVQKNIAERLKKDDDGCYFVFYSSGDAYTESEKSQKEIIITQKDIRSVQLAKAAIQAGTEILLAKANVSMEDVDEINIAGVFGKFIHPNSAIAFGLYPNICKNKMQFVGNAAGRGAAMALLDDNFKNLVEKYAKKIRHVELADEDIFKSKFLSAMTLRKW